MNCEHCYEVEVGENEHSGVIDYDTYCTNPKCTNYNGRKLNVTREQINNACQDIIAKIRWENQLRRETQKENIKDRDFLRDFKSSRVFEQISKLRNEKNKS